MGTLIPAAGITAAPAARRRIRMPGAIPAPLVWSWLGHTLDISRTNLAALGLAQHSILGTGGSVQTSGALTFLRTNANSNRLSASIQEPASWTIVTVWRSLDTFAGAAFRPALGGWYNSSLPTGTRGGGVIMNTNTNVQLLANFDNAGTPQTVSANFAIVDPTIWRLMAFTVTSGVGLTIRDLTAGTTASTANTNPRLTRTADCLIGGTYDQPSGQGDHAMFALWNSALTAEQMTLLRTSVIAPLMATRGITV